MSKLDEFKEYVIDQHKEIMTSDRVIFTLFDCMTEAQRQEAIKKNPEVKRYYHLRYKGEWRVK